MVLANPSEDDFSESDEENENENSITNDEENAGIPEHKFVYKETKFMSGKKKGQSKKLVTLRIAPNTFTRRKVQKDTAIFICNECYNEGYNTYAKAVIKNETYELIQWPEHHECSPSLNMKIALQVSVC